MIIANHKPVAIIGYPASSMCHEFSSAISKTHSVTVIEPKNYLALKNPHDYQYIVSSWIDLDEREQIVEHVDQQGLDLVTYIDDTVVVDRTPSGIVEPGSFVFAFSTIGLGSHVGRHSILSAYTLVGHYVTIGKACITRPGVIIVGKSHIGNYCVLNVRSTVVNGATICDHVNVIGFSSVTKDITQPGKYGGTPARRLGS